MRKLQDKYLAIRDLNIRYWSAGDRGKAVILIHGFGTSVEIWQHNIDELAKEFRVYAFDIPGFGRSDKTPVHDFLPFMTGFIHDFMQALSIDRAGFVGVSLGGALSIAFALKHPARVEKIVLVDSAGLGTDFPFILCLASLPLVGEILTRPSRKGVYRFFRPLVHNPAVLDDELIDFYHGVHSLPGAQQSLLRILRTFCSIFGTDRNVLLPFMSALGEIKAPALIIWGRHDRSFPVEHAYYGHERIKDSLIYIVDRSVHLPNLEKPGEFNRVVHEFLAGTYH